MNIEAKHIKNKKRVGTLNGNAVIQICTTGGLYVLACQKAGKPEILGSGPHQGVARFIAERANPDLKLFELSKSEQVDRKALESMADKYQQLTDYLNSKL